MIAGLLIALFCFVIIIVALLSAISGEEDK